MKRYTLAVFSLLAGGLTYAQTLPEAIKKTDNERYEEAAKDFRKLLTQAGASQGDVHFFYGENFFQKDELDSAKIIWLKGAEVDPTNNFSLIGKGKVSWLNGDKAGATEIFEGVLKATKRKNAEVIRQIAAVYLYSPVTDLNQAVALLNEAIKLEPKNQTSYLMLGDAQVELNPRNSTEAMKSYNAAENILSNARVYVRKAKIYQRAQNPKLADSLYQVAQNLEPVYAPAYRERAELNMRYNMINQSIQNWVKYLQLNDSEYARYRYATSLFLGKKYAENVAEIETLHAGGFNNLYTKRMMAYSLYELAVASESVDQAKLKQALTQLDDLIAGGPADKVIATDYKYRALIYEKLGNTEKYLSEMEFAADYDKVNAGEIYADLAKYYMKEKKYNEAIAVFEKKMDGKPSNLTIAEHYELGRAYYFGPQNYEKVDEANARVLELSPNYAMSHLWRGRAQVQLDLQKVTWAAKPHYEKFLELLSEDEKKGAYKSMVIEASKYLGDYYVNSSEKNIDKAKEIWGLIKTLDPTDVQAINFFKTVK